MSAPILVAGHPGGGSFNTTRTIGRLRRPVAYRARLRRVMQMSDIVKVSEEDVTWLHPGRPALESARALLELGPRAVLLTRGADGATVLTRDGDTHVAAVPVVVVDTIGAGDAFSGGVLAWWSSHALGRQDLARHELVLEAARFAAVVAARTVARAGASPPALAADAPALLGVRSL